MLMRRRTMIAVSSSDDRAAVEHWLRGRRDASPFHRPAWIEAAAAGTGQEAIMLTARDGEGGIVGLLPLVLVHSPVFGRALVSSGFGVDGGIVADDSSVAAALADAAVSMAERRSCDGLELRGGCPPGSGWTVKDDAHLAFARPLARDDETELLAIPRKHRAEVRKGLARGYRVTVGRDARHRVVHHALYRRTVHNLGTPVFPARLFDAVMDGFGEDADILTVWDGDTPLSAVLSLYHGGACLPYWQGADREARAARSNEVLYFSLMAHARSRGCDRFDFGRSKVGSGAAAYKRNWGFEGRPLVYYARAAEGRGMRDVDPLSPRHQAKIALWKRLPPVVADRLGPWIARGIG